MKKYLIDQIQPSIDQRDLKYLSRAVKNNFVTEGKYTELFENKIKKLIDTKYALAINNWTMGLFCGIKAFNLNKDDEIIIPNFTFISCIVAPELAKVKVRLCDIREDNLCIDLDKAEKLINKKTKAIMIVHMFGSICDMEKLNYIKKKYNILVIEDAAQALGGKYKNKAIGSFGDISGFSFYGNKIITTGEGGILLTNKKKYYYEALKLKNYGRKKKGHYIHDSIGYNFKFSDLNAALGISQLEKLPKMIKQKNFIDHFYKTELANVKEIKFFKSNFDEKPVYWMIAITVKKKNSLKKFLHRNRIETRDVFYPLNKQKFVKNQNFIKNAKLSFPVSLKMYKTTLCLPSSASISQKDLKTVCDNIKSFYGYRN